MNRWSLLALLTVLIGGGGTLLLDQYLTIRWANSGTRVPLGQRSRIELEPGPALVYYESRHGVPTDFVDFMMQAESGTIVYSDPPKGHESFHMWTTGWSGRPLWSLEIPAAGTYVAYARNDNIDDLDRSGDRIVFAKRPMSLEDVPRNGIRVGGAITTLVVALGFLVMAFRTGRGA